ncbi:unnamed protein product [Lactuca saligna]|uniref:Uncharacterized protein n=1 Tax=Lactuca saligna TaxID=75948 RepID=A0AA36DXV9_LACSI|nr:unnamed protein product [Lactuca saligna]
MFFEADFPKINQDDIRSLIIWLKQRASTYKAYADVLKHLRKYVLDMVIDFSVDWEIGQLGEKEAEEPNLDLNMENESPGIIGLLKRTVDQDESLRVKIIEELTWFLSFGNG